jgi:hypothetical protein
MQWRRRGSAIGFMLVVISVIGFTKSQTLHLPSHPQGNHRDINDILIKEL